MLSEAELLPQVTELDVDTQGCGTQAHALKHTFECHADTLC